jgi:hypothetical protein
LLEAEPAARESFRNRGKGVVAGHTPISGKFARNGTDGRNSDLEVQEMKLMLITTYPLTSTSKVVDLFLEIASKDPLPDYIEMLDIYSHWGGEGIKAYALYDIKENIDEGIMEITKRMVRYASIDGYKIDSQVVLPIAEALAVLGKEMPAA